MQIERKRKKGRQIDANKEKGRQKKEMDSARERK